jgi:cobalt-zinc-cadmium efflux system outer membrane protein
VAQLSFTLPLWDRSQGRIRAARGDVASASAHVERVENELAALAAESLGEYLAADQLVEAYRDRIVPAAEEALAQIDELRERGEFDFMRGLQAQRAVAESELALVGAQEARWQAAAELAGLLQLEEFP